MAKKLKEAESDAAATPNAEDIERAELLAEECSPELLAMFTADGPEEE